jgi:hypothetical protein
VEDARKSCSHAPGHRAMLIGMVDLTSMLWAWVVSSKPELDSDHGRVDESQGDP